MHTDFIAMCITNKKAMSKNHVVSKVCIPTTFSQIKKNMDSVKSPRSLKCSHHATNITL